MNLVELCLPSGTLWCDRNLGASNIYNYGDYYAWGELETKRSYRSNNYRFIDYIPNQSNPSKYGPKDNKGQLELIDDCAFNSNPNLYIPTKYEWAELRLFCRAELREIKGKPTLVVTSQINNNYILLPLTGYRYDDNHFYKDSMGTYWTATRDCGTRWSAKAAVFSTHDIDIVCVEKFEGLCIRPVSKNFDLLI